MAFFENNCPNGQFEYAIETGEYAVKLPNQARSAKQDDLKSLAEMLEKSTT
ncbi:hypothetical protein [Pseudomonas khavaziana]|uniref:DUF1508 domain-containing protein n=1 Tax=Pseudomonas khavaziana TaxID=2842351 RepID=A0ABZ2DF40_9PSED